MQRISFTTLATPGRSVREVAGMARRYGYDGVDLRVSAHMGEIMPDAPAVDIRETRAILEGEGVATSSLMSYLAYPDGLTPGELTRSLRDQLCRQLEIAGILGAKAVRVIGARVKDRPYTTELTEALSAIAGELDAIDIVIQNHVGAFTAAESLSVVDALRSPNISLAFSPDHCVLMQEDVPSVYPKLKGKVRKLFISDLRFSETGPYMVLPGQGDIPFRESYGALDAWGFDGWVSLKYEKLWHPELEEPDVSLPYFIDHAPEWFGSRQK